MTENYKNIYGYTDDGLLHLYKLFAQYHDSLLDQPSVHCEIGVFLGRSLCYFAELIKDLNNKTTRIVGIDNYTGEVGATDQQEIVKECGGSFYYKFLQNMKEVGVLDLITPYQLTSELAVNLFDDNSIDTLFLDSEHLYDHVINQLNSWYPKVKSGSFVGLHDYYDGTQVKAAVDEFTQKKGLNIRVFGTSVLFQKPLDK